MTNQEKIAQLALAALRSASQPESQPKPATYTAPHQPYQPGQMAAPSAEPIPAAAPVAAQPVMSLAAMIEAAPQAAPATPGHTGEDESELRSLIEARDEKKEKRSKLQKRIVNGAVLASLASVGIWIANSPKAQATLKSIGPAMQKSWSDAKTLGSLTEQYDKQLKKVAVHSDHLDDATRAMGVDPASVSKNEDPNMEAELKQMTGGEKTTMDSARQLKEKFGIVEKLAGREKAPASEPASAASDSPQ